MPCLGRWTVAYRLRIPANSSPVSSDPQGEGLKTTREYYPAGASDFALPTAEAVLPRNSITLSLPRSLAYMTSTSLAGWTALIQDSRRRRGSTRTAVVATLQKIESRY